MVINGYECCGMVCCKACMIVAGIEGGTSFICPNCTMAKDSGEMSDELERSPKSEEDLLRLLIKDESMYMDEALIIAELQEEPIPVENNRCKSQHFRPAGKNVQFKGIYDCAVIIRGLYESKEKVFNLPKTNK